MRNVTGLNQSVRYSVKRALALAALAACGAGSFAAHAQPATTVAATATDAKSTAAKSTATKSALRRGAAAKATTAQAPIVLAQTTPPPPASPSPPVLETVVVTGTLIARPQAETAEAISVISATTLQNQGIVNVEQALDTLTANNPTINVSSSVGSFSGGGTYANLRDLGSVRTLVLLDGQRLAGNAFNNNPAAMRSI